MTTAMPLAITIAGPAEVLEELRGRLQALGLSVSGTTLLDSSGDALDAPMSGRKLVAALGIVTALFNTGTAGLEFAQELQNVLQQHEGVTLVVNDARTNDPLAEITALTPLGAITDALGAAQGSAGG